MKALIPMRLGNPFLIKSNNMKSTLLVVFALASSICYGQKGGGIFTLDGKLFGSNDAGFKSGFTMSGAGILHEPGQKKSKGILLGAGAGVHILQQGGTPYFPIFLEVGYLNKEAKIFPYINIRGGYGFNDSETIKGGIYSEFRGGVCFKVGVCRFTPYAGLTIAQFRAKVNGRVLASTNEGMFVAGLAFVLAR